MRYRFIPVLVLMVIAAGIAFAASGEFDPPDPRLDKKVTMDADHAKLEDVVKRITEQTGVAIKAGSGARDWKVRERRVTIHAKEVPAITLMRQISKLLGFYLSREGKKDEWSYLYWQDAKSRMLESELLTAQKEAEAQRIRAMRQGMLDDAKKALATTKEEALKHRDKDPWTALMGGTDYGRGFSQVFDTLATDFPTERELMLRGQRVTLPLAGVSPRMLEAISGVRSASMKLMNMSGDSEEAQERQKALVPYQLTIMPMDQLSGRQAGMLGFGGFVVITGAKPGEKPTDDNGLFGSGSPIGILPLAASDSPVARMFGKMFLALAEGAKPEEAAKQMQGEAQNMESALAQAFARKSATEADPPDDPELTREIEIDGKALGSGMAAFADMVKANGKAIAEVSKAAGIPVLQESFATTLPLSMFLKPGKQPFYNVLVSIEKAGCAWTREEGLLRVRPDDWAMERSFEIPESFTNQYKALLEKNGEFTLDEIATMAISLTDDQIQNRLLQDPDLGVGVLPLSGLMGSRNLLRVYGLSTAQQRAAMQSEQGLPFAAISNKQWDYLNPFLVDSFQGLYILDGSLRLKTPPPPQKSKEPATRNDPDEVQVVGSGTSEFVITVQIGGEKEPRTISQKLRMSSKEQIAQAIKARKQMQEQMEKEKEKEAEAKKDATKPVPAPPK